MESFNSTDGWYEGRPVASGSTPQNRSSARSSPPTKSSITRTGLSSQIQSSRHSGNSVLCPRSTPSTKRLISFSRESVRENRTPRRFHTARVNSLHYRAAALLSASPQLAEAVRAAKRVGVVPQPDSCTAANWAALLNHLVGEREQFFWNG